MRSGKLDVCRMGWWVGVEGGLECSQIVGEFRRGFRGTCTGSFEEDSGWVVMSRS